MQKRNQTMPHKPTIAILGAGNMGSALAGGLITDKYPAKNIWLSDLSAERLELLHKTLGVNVTTDNDKAIQQAEVIVFAVKPQIMPKIVKSLANTIHAHKPLIMSIAAGIREESIQKWVGGNMPIVRIMPNTPALIGCGASGLYANQFVSAEQHDLAESIMRSVGVAVWLTHEKWIDTVTALSGSGPAYFFLVIEALQMAAEELGLPADIARLLSLQTAYGSARMALESEKHVKELRQQVTSAGGTTERAVSVLEEGNIRKLLAKALQAAKERSEELASALSEDK
jgi:pyrroline-5-carboxylate reductase